ncbi:polyprotein [Plasmopara halstedii]|uniref:Polyprotein n=1 Tax=Plasmopara halstedii TaxID=4781 RepID=A0A0P1ACF0_PLAHL|nr:polyprotein [Plasmopara halstedii]CEG38584.1 polyprotein [Plasmopara halstedii]|eukprot:XP_024574953.1 polyprotein [Plasmopara halstedii]
MPDGLKVIKVMIANEAVRENPVLDLRASAKCGQVGHFKRDCRKRSNTEEDDAVFAVGEKRCAGWPIDSGATCHMTPHQSDLFDYEVLSGGSEVTIADGKRLQVTGKGAVELIGLDNVRIKVVEVLHISGLDRRLLSVGKPAELGLRLHFKAPPVSSGVQGVLLLKATELAKHTCWTASKKRLGL